MAAIYFPREIVPISYVLASLVDFVIALFVLFFMMICYSISISMTAFFALPILGILVMLVIAICLLLSSVQVRLRDIGIALPMILQVLLFTAPIVYPASVVPPALWSPYWLNPFAILIQSFRDAVVGGRVPSAGDLLYCSAVALTSFLISYLIFKKIEPSIVDDM